MKGFLIAFVIAFTVGVLTSCSKDDVNEPCYTQVKATLNGTTFYTTTTLKEWSKDRDLTKWKDVKQVTFCPGIGYK